MVTKRTRLMSAVVAVLMLVSMLTAFVLPVSAATTGNYDEVAGTALVDKTALNDIKNGLVTGVTEYKVTDRAGMDKLVEIVRTNELQHYTIYQMADIDMGWIPFEGIGGHNSADANGNNVHKNFRANWDGNGFVIKNLYINRIGAGADNSTGLFNAMYMNWGGATIKNLGIANGLIIGYDRVGSIVGNLTQGYDGNAANSGFLRFINCWSAATVVGVGSNGVGGLVGTSVAFYNDSGFYNCYFLGNVINARTEYVGGLEAWHSTSHANGVSAASHHIKNSYNAGAIIAGGYSTTNNAVSGTLHDPYTLYVDSADGVTKYAKGNQAIGYNAIFRINAADSNFKNENFTNNFYLDTIGAKSYKDALEELGGYGKATTDETTGVTTYSKAGDLIVSDGATGVNATELASLAERLNVDITNNTGTGYTVKYSDSTAGFPVLTYYDSENNIIAKRLPTNPEAIGGKGYLASKSALLKKYIEELAYGGTFRNGKLENIEIADANDLMAAILLTTGMDGTQYTTGKFLFTADVDASAQTMIPGLPYFSSFNGRGDFKSKIDGQNHILYNFHNYSVLMNREPAASLVHRLGSGGEIANLGMVNAKGTFDFAFGSTSYAHPSLMVAQVADTAVGAAVTNCFATGDIYLKTTNGNIANTNDYAGLIGCIRRGNGNTCTVTNSWADATVHKADGSTQKARAVGTVSIKTTDKDAAVVTWNNVAFIAPAQVTHYGAIADGNTSIDLNNQPYLNIANNDGELAWYMNNKNATLGQDGLWTVKDDAVTGGKITAFGNASNATRRIASNFLLADGSVDYTTYEYVNAGTEYTIKSYDLYELSAEPEGTVDGKFTVVADTAINYALTGANYTPAQEIVDELSKYDLNLFANGAALEAAMDKANEALAYQELEETPENITAANALVVEAVDLREAAGNITMASLYYNSDEDYLGPLGRDYPLYKAFNPTVWIVDDQADWRGLVGAGAVTFEGATIHFVDNINMGNTHVNPLSYGTDFKGHIDGHKHEINDLKIEMTSSVATRVGLVSKSMTNVTTVGIYTIKNLGIASGSIKLTGSKDESMVGAFIGQATNVSFINCWNAADVTYVSTGGSACVAGIGRLQGYCRIDGCYNLGTLLNQNGRTAGLSEWTYNTTLVANSYSRMGNSTATSGKVGVVNQNHSTAGLHKNTYGVGYEKFVGNQTVAGYENYLVTAETMASGELAYKLNVGYTATTGTQTYYTMKNGVPIIGTEENQTRTVTFTAEGAENKIEYHNSGTPITLNYADNVESYEITEGTGVLENNGDVWTLKLTGEDVTVKVTLAGANKTELQARYDKYIVAKGDYFETADGESASVLLAEAKEVLDDEAAEQTTVDALVDEFDALVYRAYPNVPLASEFATYPDAPGYRIVTPADMEALSQYDGDFAAGTTMYLMNDLNMTGSTYAGTFQFKGNFEGNGYTISNMDFNGTGMFSHYEGSFIKNLTITDSKVTVTGVQAWDQPSHRTGLLVGNYNGTKLDIDNVHIKNSTYDNSTTGSNAAGAIFLSRTNTAATITITNSGIDGCIYDQNNQGANLGLFLGQMTSGAVITVENIYVTNNHIKEAANLGLFAGCVEGAADLYATNLLIADNKISDDKTTSHNTCRLADQIKSAGTNVEWNRVVVTGTVLDMALTADVTNDMMVNNDDALPPDSYKCIDCYFEGSKWVQNNINTLTATGGQLKITAGDLPEIAYLLNSKSAETDYKWEIADGAIVRDTDGEGLPAKVTFNIVTPDDAATLVESYELYTDVNGNVVNFASIADKAAWEDEENIATTVYAEGDTVNGYVIPEHTHAWICTDPNAEEDTHTATCSMSWTKNGVTVACGATEKQDCVFDGSAVIVDANAEPGAASHTVACACTNTTVVLCSEAGEWEVVTTPATCYVAGTTVYSCAACGYTHTDNLEKREHSFGAWTADEVVEGATQTHSRRCTHTDPACAGSTSVETEACTYSGNWVVVTKPGASAGLQVKYCDKGCGSTIEQELAAIAAIDVKAETGYSGKDMNVDIEVHNHTGIAGLGLLVTYDSDVMTFNEAVKGALVGDVPAYIEVSDVSEADENGLVSVRIDAIWNKNVVAEGAVLTLNYSVDKEAASGEYTFNVEVLDAANYDGVTLFFSGVETTVDIESIVLGDIDGDRDVSIGDAVLMLRVACQDDTLDYSLLDLNAADVVEEGNIGDQVINTNDIIMILRVIAGLVEL